MGHFEVDESDDGLMSDKNCAFSVTGGRGFGGIAVPASGVLGERRNGSQERPGAHGLFRRNVRGHIDEKRKTSWYFAKTAQKEAFLAWFADNIDRFG